MRKRICRFVGFRFSGMIPVNLLVMCYDFHVSFCMQMSPTFLLFTCLQPTGWALVNGNPNGSMPFPAPGTGTHVEVGKTFAVIRCFPALCAASLSSVHHGFISISPRHRWTLQRETAPSSLCLGATMTLGEAVRFFMHSSAPTLGAFHFAQQPPYRLRVVHGGRGSSFDFCR